MQIVIYKREKKEKKNEKKNVYHLRMETANVHERDKWRGTFAVYTSFENNNMADQYTVNQYCDVVVYWAVFGTLLI